MAVMTPQEVLDLLEDPDFITEVTFEGYASKTYAVATGKVTETGPSDIDIVVSPAIYTTRYQDESLVKEGDQIRYFSPTGLSELPVINTKFTINSTVWTVIKIVPMEGGESTIAAYEIGLRQ